MTGSSGRLDGARCQGPCRRRSCIQAAHVGIDVSIGMSVVPGFPTAEPEEISPVYWELHTTHRDEAERVFSR
jgi:hypothetical protein